MAKYFVTGVVTISVNTGVEADSAEEAKEKANERSIMSLCHFCAHGENRDSEWVTSGELDGEPQDIKAELE